VKLDRCREIMESFAQSSGLEGDAPPRRYLWTDAFAVCTFLGLEEATGNARFRELAVRLVDQVHQILGRHRSDDLRSGWISGLPEQEGSRHPTAGGLRIGKSEPERTAKEPWDPRREWERDGQYFHYLTRWMQALNRAYAVTTVGSYYRWAVELARAAHAAFVGRDASGPFLVWKMSIDLSRPLVASTGAHDPLDGLLTLCELRSSAVEPSDLLRREVVELATMCQGRRWATDDPLGAGGLLTDLFRSIQLMNAGTLDERPGGLHVEELVSSLFDESLASLAALVSSGFSSRPPEHRLAFRELGLAIGLSAISRIRASDLADLSPRSHATDRLEALRTYLPIRDAVLACWLDSDRQHARTWTEHLHINQVMLATALVPDGYLGSHQNRNGP
jgi:hypothetical protein